MMKKKEKVNKLYPCHECGIEFPKNKLESIFCGDGAKALVCKGCLQYIMATMLTLENYDFID
jgi:hypothetical protein